MAKLSLEDRFWAKVAKGSPKDCWEWTASRKTNGYGQFSVGTFRANKMAQAHRVAWELTNGPVPDGLELDHLCRNRACCNPTHLEPVTRSENIRRGLGGGLITHCPQGHEYTSENTYLYPRTGWRQCRECFRANARRQRARKRAESLGT